MVGWKGESMVEVWLALSAGEARGRRTANGRKQEGWLTFFLVAFFFGAA